MKYKIKLFCGESVKVISAYSFIFATRICDVCLSYGDHAAIDVIDEYGKNIGRIALFKDKKRFFYYADIPDKISFNHGMQREYQTLGIDPDAPVLGVLDVNRDG